MGKVNKTLLKQYARFLALPYNLRGKEFGVNTKEGFAKKVGVSVKTLWKWEKKSEFKEMVNECLKEWSKEKTPNVIMRLYKSILEKGNASEIKLWLQFIEGWSEKIEQELSGGVSIIEYNRPDDKKLLEVYKKLKEESED